VGGWVVGGSGDSGVRSGGVGGAGLWLVLKGV
jgi:hypothetical protein